MLQSFLYIRTTNSKIRKKRKGALEEEGWMAVRRAGRKDGWSDELIGNNTILRPY